MPTREEVKTREKMNDREEVLETKGARLGMCLGMNMMRRIRRRKINDTEKLWRCLPSLLQRGRSETETYPRVGA